MENQQPFNTQMQDSPTEGKHKYKGGLVMLELSSALPRREDNESCEALLQHTNVLPIHTPIFSRK